MTLYQPYPILHFKIIRYYGFLANRKRGTVLLKVYDALDMKVKDKPQNQDFTSLMKQFMNVYCAAGE